MDIFYINLADQADRRRNLESNFQANNDLRWALCRVDAIPAHAVAQVPGRLRDSEKACFQSHIKAIEMAKQSPGHVLIAEDDLQFGARSLQKIENALRLVPEGSWDIIFTDVCITNTHAMLDLLMLRRGAAGGFKLINLARLPFAGATAYIVNRASKDKVIEVVSHGGPLEIPYDINLQQAIRDNKLRGFVTFPFATTLSPYAENSQVRQSQSAQEAAMNAFRRLMWLERDIDTAVEHMDRICTGMDDAETVAVLKILAVFLSPGLPAK
jgi:GR25 family glycosyltransferase involved in LPS biosynthesis